MGGWEGRLGQEGEGCALTQLPPHAIDEPARTLEHVTLDDPDDVPARFLHSLAPLDVIGEDRRVRAMSVAWAQLPRKTTVTRPCRLLPAGS